MRGAPRGKRANAVTLTRKTRGSRQVTRVTLSSKRKAEVVEGWDVARKMGRRRKKRQLTEEGRR